MIRELRPLQPYIKKYTRVYAAGLACVVGSNLLNMLAPYFLQRGVDALAGVDPIRAASRAALAIVGVAVGGGVLRYAMRRILNGVSRRVERDVRGALFSKLLALPPSFHDGMPIGDVMARATNDLASARMVAGPAIMYTFDTLTRAVILIPAMIAVHPTLALLALVPLLPLPWLEARLGRTIHERAALIQAHFGRLTDYVHQNVSGVRIVRAYNQETREIDGFARLNEEYVRLNLSLARAQAALNPMLTLLGGLSAAVVLLVGGRLVLAGSVSVGAFVAFFVYLALLIWPLIFLGWAVNLTMRATAAMQRLNRIFEEPETLVSGAPAVPLPTTVAARSVTFENVWFRYPTAPEGQWAVADVSFHLPAGESMAVVGATGAGKTALMELLVRLYDPDRGRVLVDGIDVRDLDLAELRRAVGFVPQETFLFSDTVRDNVLLGEPDDGRLVEALTVSHLTDAIPDLPAGLDTMLGERGVNLSGGQRQRTAIARALVRRPAIVVLDDSLSAVDAETEARILRELRQTLRDRSVIVVSHRAVAVREARQILVMDGGRVVERGRYAQLLAADGQFANLVRRQLLEEELSRFTTTAAGPPGSEPEASSPDE